MKLVRTVSFVLAMASAGSVLAAPDAKPAPVASPDASRFLAFLDKLVATVVADKDNCPKMGPDMNALIDDNQDALAAAKAARASGKQPPQDVKDHVAADIKQMIPAVGTCGKDPKVKAAFQRLDMR